MLFLTKNLDSFVLLNLHNSVRTVSLDFPHVNAQMEISRLQDAKRLGIQVPLYISSRQNRKLEIEVKNSALNTNPLPFYGHWW